jgi:hypothetical protein
MSSSLGIRSSTINTITHPRGSMAVVAATACTLRRSTRGTSGCWTQCLPRHSPLGPRRLLCARRRRRSASSSRRPLASSSSRAA